MSASSHSIGNDDLFGRSLSIALATAAGIPLQHPAAERATAARTRTDPPQGWLARLDAWFYRQQQRDREAWLAQSQDIFELEERLRQLDRRPYC